MGAGYGGEVGRVWGQGMGGRLAGYGGRVWGGGWGEVGCVEGGVFSLPLLTWSTYKVLVPVGGWALGLCACLCVP